jgi:multiple sugar transport system substrate-binding protein
MRLRSRLFAGFAALIFAAMPVFAGGSGEQQGSVSGVTTITFGGWPNANFALDAVLPGFYGKYPNIKVEYEMSDFAAHHQALQTALAAGTGARDVEMIDTSYVANYRDSKAIENLGGAPYNDTKYQNDFVPYKWSMGYSSDKTRHVGIPWDIGPMGYFYRADIFESAGLPTAPEEVAKLMSTWQGVLEVAKKVSIPGQRWFISSASLLYDMLWRNRDYYDEQLNFRLDRSGDTDALNAVIEIRKNGYDMNSTTNSEIWAAMQNNAIASVVTAAWYEGNLKVRYCADQSGKWRVTSLPAGTKPTNNGGTFWIIPAQSKNKEAAWKLIEYVLCTPEGQNAMKTIGYFPSLKTAWADPMYNEPDPYYSGEKVAAFWANVAGEMTTNTFATLMDSTVSGLIVPTVDEGLAQNMTARQIKDLIKTKVESATAEQRRQQIDIFKETGFWK